MAESLKRPNNLRLTYTHDAVIDLILHEPTVTQKELAEIFDKSPAWVSRVLAADSFQARIAERKSQLIDPQIAQSLNERLKGVTIQSLEIISEKLDSADASAQYAIDALGMAQRGLTQSSRGR